MKRPVLVVLLGVAVLACMALVVAQDQPGSLTILYTNDNTGYLEPCGCGGNNLGGLARRASTVQRLKAEIRDPILVVDSGNIAPTLALAEVIYPAMAKMGYTDFTVSASDLWVGPELKKLAEQAGMTMHRLTLKRPPANRIIIRELGQCKVGIFGIDEEAAKQGLDRIVECVRPMVEDIRPDVDLVVALSRLGLDRDTRLAEEAPGIDVIIGNRDAERLTEPKMVGSTAIVPTDSRGQRILRLDVRLAKARPHQYAFSRIDLTPELDADPKIEAEVKKYFETAFAQAAAQPPDVKPKYIRPGKCGECHIDQFRIWQSVPHARATQVLIEQGKLVPECLKCHSEKYRRTGQGPADSDIGDGVQCSACHGAGVNHAEANDRRFILRQVPSSRCVECHDPDNSPKFDYAKYRQRIKHWTEPTPLGSSARQP